MIKLTERSHEILGAFVRPGDRVVDATCGNGYDTEFLAQQVGEEGAVIACDLQPAAVNSTLLRLSQSGLARRATVVKASHAEWSEVLPCDWRGTVSVFVYNLGYLPHGDKSITTVTPTTLQSLREALVWLRVGGMIMVTAYPGHTAGAEEAGAVKQWWAELPESLWTKQCITNPETRRPSPILFVASGRCD